MEITAQQKRNNELWVVRCPDVKKEKKKITETAALSKLDLSSKHMETEEIVQGI